MGESNKINKNYISEDSMSDLWNVWYSELHEGSSGITLKIERVIESTTSEFQRIDVIENKDFGKMLVLYGSLMVAENDNNAYNEMIVHPALFVHQNPKAALIIGGGDCGALTEMTKHPQLEKIVMCEIDEKVVEVSKKHFPLLTKGISDPRANIIFEDGKKFIENSKKKYDLIVLDLSDPIGPAADLFQKEFHQKVFDTLNDDGILVAQTEAPFYNKQTVKQMYKNLKEIFPIVKMYTCFMPIYPSTYWSFAFCSKKYDPLKDFRKDLYEQLALKTKYYNSDIHFGAFALPQFVKEVID